MQTCILKVAYIIIISDLKSPNWKEKDTMLQTAQLKLEKIKEKKKQDSNPPSDFLHCFHLQSSFLHLHLSPSEQQCL
jgi:hypothetical protein